MKKLPGVLLFTMFVFVSSAQQRDAKSQEILKGVSAKYKSFKSVFASFKISIENLKDKTTQNQKGSILLKANKYKLDITGQQIISDGNSTWTFLKESNEVQINDANMKSDGITPANIFTVYETGFDSKYIGDKKIGNKDFQQVELTPTDKKKPYYKIQLLINKAEKYVHSATVFNNNGTRLQYSVEKFTPNPPADDSNFVFDPKKFPGVEVVDLR